MAPVTCSSSFCDLSFVPYRSEHRTLDSRLFTKVSRSWIACVSPVRLGLENRSGNTVAGQRSEETWSNNSAKKKSENSIKNSKLLEKFTLHLDASESEKEIFNRIIPGNLGPHPHVFNRFYSNTDIFYPVGPSMHSFTKANAPKKILKTAAQSGDFWKRRLLNRLRVNGKDKGERRFTREH